MTTQELIIELVGKEEGWYTVLSDKEGTRLVEISIVKKLIERLVEHCAKKAEACAPTYRDLMGEGQRVTARTIAREIRNLIS